MADNDIADALAALSVRVIVLEGAIASLAPREADKQALTLTTFDNFERELLDRYVGLPIEETFLDLLRQSFADVRTLLGQSDHDRSLAANCEQARSKEYTQTRLR